MFENPRKAPRLIRITDATGIPTEFSQCPSSRFFSLIPLSNRFLLKEGLIFLHGQIPLCLKMVDWDVQAGGGGRGEAAEAVEEEEQTASSASNSLENTREVQELVDLIRSAAAIGDYRKTQKRDCQNLVRRLKIFLSLLEEVRELHGQIPEKLLPPFLSLKKALLDAKQLLITCSQGSKIFLVGF